jgi:formylglycine-generating enzyme required for sulfatase activity
MRTRVFRFRVTSAALVSLGLFGCRDATQITVKVTNDFGCARYRMQETGVVVSTLKRRQEYWDIKDAEKADVPPLATRSSNCEELSTDPNSPLATIGELVIVPSGSNNGSVTFTIVGAWGPRQGTGTGGGSSTQGAGTSAGGAGTSTVEPLTAEQCMTVAGRNLEYTGQCDASKNPECEPQVGCIWASRTVRFIPHTNVELTVPLRFDCSNVPCRGFETCEGGGCVPIPSGNEPPSATGGTGGTAGAGPEPTTGGTGGVPAVGGTGGTSSGAAGGTGGTNTGGWAGDGIVSKQSCAAGLKCGVDNIDCCTSLPLPAESKFLLGRGSSQDAYLNGEPNESPEQSVSIFAFELDKFEVTQSRYDAFLAARVAGWRPPAGSGAVPGSPSSGWQTAWDRNLDNALKAESDCDSRYHSSSGPTFPRACMTWFSAFAFCVWDGARLPTEAEREYAAATNKNFLYVWPSGTPSSWEIPLPQELAAVGLLPKADGVFGHSDLLLGVQEWTRDGEPASYNQPCGSPCVRLESSATARHVVRGGQYQTSAANEATLRSAWRVLVNSFQPSHAIGVRCARN